jgi:FkbM family methyltransferase
MIPVAQLRIPEINRPLRLHIHGEQDLHVSRRIREEGIWEPYETSLVLDILRPGGVFVDVGANIGYFSIIAASAVGSEGQVLAFEPEQENCRLLRESAVLNGFEGLIQLEQAGLANSDTRGRLYLSEDNLGDHQIYSDEDQERGSVPIQLLNGSEYLSSRLSRLDLLKVDTQGSEFDVMAGLMPFLAELADPVRIIIELTPLSLRKAGASGRHLIALLARLGQPMWIIDHIEHRLVTSSAEDVAQWCDDVDAVPGDAGFINILVGRSP